MAPDNKFATTTATGDRVDVAMAANDEVTTPTATKMDDDHMSGDEENLSRSHSASQDQIGGGTNANAKPCTAFTGNPQTLRCAQVQGLAKLNQVLNDPKREIEDNIRKTAGWNKTLASNERCKKVRKYISDEKETIDEHTVPYVLATWCMLGAVVPSVWIKGEKGEKSGFKGKYTAWGKKMVDELQLIGCGHEFEIFKDFDNGSTSVRNAFNWDEWEEILDNPPDGMHNAKEKSKPARKRATLSPRQSYAAKRQKTATIDVSQQSEGYHADDDDTEDEGSRAGMSKDVKDSGKGGEQVWNTQSPVMNLNHREFSSLQVPRDGRRDREDAPPPLQKRCTPSGDNRNQGLEGNFGNDAGARLYGPGLTSNMSSNKTFVGRMSHGRQNRVPLRKPTASGITTGNLSSSKPDSTASSGQPLLGMRSAFQQGPAVPPGRSTSEVSASVNWSSAVPHHRFYSALDNPSGLGNLNLVKDGGIDDALLSSSSQQDPMPGRHQNTPQITASGDRGSYDRGEASGTGNHGLSSLPVLDSANHEAPHGLDETVSDPDKLGAFVSGEQPRDLSQDPTQLSTRFPALIDHLEVSVKLAKALQKGVMDQDKRNIDHNDGITRLEEELAGCHNKDQAKDAKIATLEKAWRAADDNRDQLEGRIAGLEEALKKLQRREDLLNRTSALTILQTAGTTGKGRLDTISLAELLDEMEGGDGTGASA